MAPFLCSGGRLHAGIVESRIQPTEGKYVCSTIAATSSSLATLQRMAIALWPAATSCSAAARATPSLMSANTIGPLSSECLHCGQAHARASACDECNVVLK
jgi:hypothetical protein